MCRTSRSLTRPTTSGLLSSRALCVTKRPAAGSSGKAALSAPSRTPDAAGSARISPRASVAVFSKYPPSRRGAILARRDTVVRCPPAEGATQEGAATDVGRRRLSPGAHDARLGPGPPRVARPVSTGAHPGAPVPRLRDGQCRLLPLAPRQRLPGPSGLSLTRHELMPSMLRISSGRRSSIAA